jgi:pimeloyl-ACP methyl ester carboxylesterase
MSSLGHSWILVCSSLVAAATVGCDQAPSSPSSSFASHEDATTQARQVITSYSDGVTRYEGVTGGENLFAFYVPDGWNGDLVLYAHGFIDAASPLELPTNDNIEAVRDRIVSDGFAFAYPSYRENGLAIKDGGWSTRQIAVLFRAVVGEPNHTWLMGHSLGGLIAVELAEKHPGEFDGVLTLAGMIGGTSQQLDYVGSVRILFDFFYPGVLPGTVLEVPEDLSVDQVIAAVVPAVMADPNGAFVISQLLCMPAPTDEALVQSLVTALAFNVRGINDVLERTHGECPIDNMDTVYDTDNPMVPPEVLAAVNALVPRYDRTDAAEAELRRNYEPSGDLEIPMIAVHRAWDPTVPVCSAARYEQLVTDQGSEGLFELRSVHEYGHASFGEDVVATALSDLISRAASTLRLAQR